MPSWPSRADSTKTGTTAPHRVSTRRAQGTWPAAPCRGTWPAAPCRAVPFLPRLPCRAARFPPRARRHRRRHTHTHTHTHALPARPLVLTRGARRVRLSRRYKLLRYKDSKPRCICGGARDIRCTAKNGVCCTWLRVQESRRQLPARHDTISSRRPCHHHQSRRRERKLCRPPENGQNRWRKGERQNRRS